MVRQTKNIYSWGRSNHGKSHIHYPTSLQELRTAIQFGTVTVRGGGMSFGDAALNNGGRVIYTNKLEKKPMQLDATRGHLFCSADVTQDNILQYICPRGWVLPTIPGSRYITLGGMIAGNVHGKNHYANGSISSYVKSMRVMLASGDIVDCSRSKTSDLFWGTIGGLGLTGIILDADIQLTKISSVYSSTIMFGFDGVDNLCELIESNKNRYEYILGWANGWSHRRDPWRGAVSFGRILNANEIKNPWDLPHSTKYRIPFPSPLPWTSQIAGWSITHAISRKFRDGVSSINDLRQFFFPQDTLFNWNIAFGFNGFIDYQICLPISNARKGLNDIHGFLYEQKIQSFLIAFKRFSASEEIHSLCFPMEGLSFSFESPIRDNLFSKLHELDAIVIENGGRLNLIKDSRTSADTVRNMYPHLDNWVDIKKYFDPSSIFVSDLARRLRFTN